LLICSDESTLIDGKTSFSLLHASAAPVLCN
jgi:hypothetical protein